MKKIIAKNFEESISVKRKALETLSEEIEKSAKIMIDALKKGKKILIFGNGGSAADAQHFAAELMIRFKKERKSLPALSLSTDVSAITACANDYGYERLFERQIEGLGNSGDVVVGITTSGNSENVIKAFDMAEKKGMKIICLNGKDGGKIKSKNVDVNLIIPSSVTARVQESHITIIHAWCELIDEEF